MLFFFKSRGPQSALSCVQASERNVCFLMHGSCAAMLLKPARLHALAAVL